MDASAAPGHPAIVGRPAGELTAPVRSGELTAVDAFPDRSRLPRAGLPVAVRDAVAVTTGGCTTQRHVPAAVAHPVAGRLRAVGALGLDRSRLGPRSRVHVRLGRLVRGAGLVGPHTAEAFRGRMAAFSTDVDVLLTPVLSGPPLPALPWQERGFLANATAGGRWAPWVSAWNLAGPPALVLPTAPRPAGTPTPVQLVGPAGAETRLPWLAGELERRLPWRRHAPVFDPLVPAGSTAG